MTLISHDPSRVPGTHLSTRPGRRRRVDWRVIPARTVRRRARAATRATRDMNDRAVVYTRDASSGVSTRARAREGREMDADPRMRDLDDGAGRTVDALWTDDDRATCRIASCAQHELFFRARCRE